MNGERVEHENACVCVLECVRACLCVPFACLHMFPPLWTMCVFAHFAAMPTTLRAPAQLE